MSKDAFMYGMILFVVLFVLILVFGYFLGWRAGMKKYDLEERALTKKILDCQKVKKNQ